MKIKETIDDVVYLPTVSPNPKDHTEFHKIEIDESSKDFKGLSLIIKRTQISPNSMFEIVSPEMAPVYVISEKLLTSIRETLKLLKDVDHLKALEKIRNAPESEFKTLEG